MKVFRIWQFGRPDLLEVPNRSGTDVGMAFRSEAPDAVDPFMVGKRCRKFLGFAGEDVHHSAG